MTGALLLRTLLGALFTCAAGRSCQVGLIAERPPEGVGLLDK